MKACCGFGHREVFENISGQVEEAVLMAIKDGCELFYTGAMGEFDSLFSSVVRRAKKTYPHIKLICVKPYMTNDINTDRGYYAAMYDDVIIPDELVGIHYKAAIKARNRWIVDHSDMVIVYTIREHGGAYEAKRYAERRSKHIIKIGEKQN
ncbi:SLOG family protein [uncultured Ruminococcus sp.]|uniref:SLOG family protein n=1 Tax=uncultured Ruminococcus sp. TaxID=165186 RepID=UPI002930CACF|nr:SLOG family protein [uncultured Ruminococcus sp.]